MAEIENLVEFSQFLTFVVAGEEYAIGILKVKEIISYSGATKVPMAPDVIRGLINLRGGAVAVVDLAVKFGSPETPTSKRTCVVIVDLESGEDMTIIGILVDSVSEVIELRADEIAAAPSFGTAVRTEHLEGLAKVGEGFVPILEIDRMLGSEELLAVIDSVRDEVESALQPAAGQGQKEPLVEARLEADGRGSDAPGPDVQRLPPEAEPEETEELELMDYQQELQQFKVCLADMVAQSM